MLETPIKPADRHDAVGGTRPTAGRWFREDEFDFSDLKAPTVRVSIRKTDLIAEVTCEKVSDAEDGIQFVLREKRMYGPGDRCLIVQ